MHENESKELKESRPPPTDLGEQECQESDTPSGFGVLGSELPGIRNSRSFVTFGIPNARTL